MKNKIYLFIDGTNLYAGQYELFGPQKYLDFGLLIKNVEQKLRIKFEKIYFYASYSPKSKKPNKKEKLFLKNEAMFYKSVKKHKKVIFFSGYRSATSGKEKEVDVKLTADLICFGFLNKYSTVYLMTGDADFLQALFALKKYHNDKKIFILNIQNKILFRGAFYFKTFIIDLKKPYKTKPNFLTFQKYEFIELDWRDLVRSV